MPGASTRLSVLPFGIVVTPSTNKVSSFIRSLARYCPQRCLVGVPPNSPGYSI